MKWSTFGERISTGFLARPLVVTESSGKSITVTNPHLLVRALFTARLCSNSNKAAESTADCQNGIGESNNTIRQRCGTGSPRLATKSGPEGVWDASPPVSAVLYLSSK
jgi:hypothetical protein